MEADSLLPNGAPGSPPVHSIVVTGAPCSGRSTCIARLSSYLRERGFDVYTTPDCAALLKTHGAVFWDMTKESKQVAFQRCVLETQISMERAMYRLAVASGKPSVILHNRGALDGAGFVAPRVWSQVLRAVGTDSLTLRDSRYHAVLHLVTAADGAEPHYAAYEAAGNAMPAHRAREVDQQIKETWVGHPRLYVFDNSADFETKLRRVVSAVSALLNLPSTTKHFRRFLLKAAPAALPAHAKTFEVEKVYLRTSALGVPHVPAHRPRAGSRKRSGSFQSGAAGPGFSSPSVRPALPPHMPPPPIPSLPPHMPPPPIPSLPTPPVAPLAPAVVDQAAPALDLGAPADRSTTVSLPAAQQQQPQQRQAAPPASGAPTPSLLALLGIEPSAAAVAPAQSSTAAPSRSTILEGASAGTSAGTSMSGPAAPVAAVSAEGEAAPAGRSVPIPITRAASSPAPGAPGPAVGVLPGHLPFRVQHTFVRRRSQGGFASYGETTVCAGPGGQRIESKRIISARDFAYAVTHQADMARHYMRVQRTCFLWEDQYFEIDEYRQPVSDLCLLNVQVPSGSKTVRLPPFVEVAKEVTGDPRYSSYFLSLRRRPESEDAVEGMRGQRSPSPSPLDAATNSDSANTPMALEL